MTSAAKGSFAESLAGVRACITAIGRDPDDIRIVAVTKGFGPEVVDMAAAEGLADVGENYAQELLAKASGVIAEVRWHFLGTVQTNKVRKLAPKVVAWHGVDRPAAADAIAVARPGAEVLVQVNVAGIQSKSGCRPDELDAIVEHCRRLPLDLSGLMTVGPQGDPVATRRCFRWLAGKAAELGLRELSMGMSDDFEVAVEEGSTTLRLGRILFGSRPGRTVAQR
jgi:pyridoxal phosphate enzyme (YggS family)